MNEFKMPSLGADMESGTVYNWMVKPGDAVKRGDIVAEVETAKGVIEIEVFEDGIVHKILVEEGSDVPVGTVLALIQTEEDEAEAIAEEVVEPVMAVAEAAAEHHPMDHRPLVSAQKTNGVAPKAGERLRVSPRARKRAADLGVDLTLVTGTGRGGAITADDVEQFMARQKAETPRITPLARRLAADLGVDIHKIQGTGPQGAICKADIEKAADRPKDVAEPPKAEVKKAAEPPKAVKKEKPRVGSPDMMRQAIALAMARANRDIPHYYLETQINMQAAMAWLEAENMRRSLRERLLPAVILIKAVAKALSEVPELNGFWREDSLELQESIHIGFAIALRQGGLVTPAIHNADLLTVDEIMEKLRDLIVRTRAGRLRGSELTDATVTLTSLGDLGVEKVYGVIYPPQIALVGLGKIMERPWAENGMLGVRPMMSATVAGDHRASDGLVGARFLEALNRHLQEVDKL